jgi:ABC-2 type transport system ATP-binding protein
MIEATGLQKRYGEQVAIQSVDVEVPAGTVLCVLGPNGAGKSTTVRILTTMTLPDAGTATVGGLDVVSQAAEVRRIIGVTGQDATLDLQLTGTQNLLMVAQLSRLSRSDARARAETLLEQFELSHAADRLVKTYSGGMRRRLDLAASLVSEPPVLFLDEPTTGLDPTSRQRVWEAIRGFVAGGTTVLLTTQYLDEADALADKISVIDHGLVIAEGTSDELKARVGGERLEVALVTPDPAAVDALTTLVSGPVHVSDDGLRLTAPVDIRPGLATAFIRALDAAGVQVDDFQIHHPSLDDVFFSLTGHAAETAEPAADLLEV